MEETQVKRPMGMRAFIIIWIGQVISLLGSAMTGFAVTIWVYEGTEKATALALTGFFYVTPLLLLSPVAGAIVDRSNRKLMMMVSDLAAGATTVVVLLLYLTGNLEVWHLFITNAISGAFQAFQWPAFSAAISVMLPKEQYGRANGMMELAGSGSQIFAPMLAGALLGPIGLTGILVIDIVTFVFAVGALLFVFIPQPETTAAGRKGQGSLWTESFYGFQYILERPSLLGLQLVFLVGNFLVSIGYTVYAAMILARTGNNELVFGSVQSAGAIGGVVGGLAMAAWGGPRRRVHGVLGGWVVSGLLFTLVGFGQSLPIWAVAAFLGSFMVPIINGSNQAIWQAKVAPDVQGRVFSIRRLIAWFVSPISALLAGPLADLVLEPAMKEGGSLAGLWGGLVGTGPGAGMALLFVIGGGLAALVGLGGYSVRAVRDAEDILPDHDSPEAQVEAEAPLEPALDGVPASKGWTLGRKVGAALASAALAVMIVGLGWLQVKVLTASEEEPVVASVADAELVATPQPSPTVAPTATLTPQPTPSPAPTFTPPPPTIVPPTAVPIDPLIAGSPLTYTLTVANNGPSDATGVVVSDTLPAGVVFNSAVASQGEGCILIPGGQETAVGDIVWCDLGSLKNGATAAVTITVAIDSVLGGMITNTARVGANEPDPNRRDNALQRENLVFAEADLVVHPDVPELAVAGQPLTYTLTVVNNGPLDASGVTITNGLSGGLTFVSASLDRGSGCTVEQGAILLDEGVTIRCEVGELSSGDRARAAVFAAVSPAAEGTITSVVMVGANETDLHLSGNVTQTVTFIEVQANLAITVVEAGSGEGIAGAEVALGSVVAGPVVAGGRMTYTLTITNNGPLRATGVVVNNTLRPGVSLLSATPSQGRGCTAGQEGTASCFLGALGASDTATVAIEVLVDAAASGTVTHTAAVSANEADPDLSNNTFSEETPVQVEADLTIE
jgi:uncharacterized repeat protein (TIGR01451 family)